MKKGEFLKLFILTGLSLVLLSHLCFAAGDDYPRKTIKFVVPFEPGAGVDRSTRIFQPFLEKELGVSVIVENRPGAGGEVGMTYLYKENPDGYILTSYNMPDHAMVCTLQSPVYKFEDIIPIVLAFVDARILVVRKDSPFNTLEDFIQEAQKNPGKLSMSVSHQTGQHMMAVILKKSLNIDVKIVPFKGAAPAATALLGGHVTLNVGDVYGRYNLRDQTKSIGIAAKQPHPFWPEAKPINDQLKKYGVTIPEVARLQNFWVPADFKKKYPERYHKLQNAILKVSQNKEYMEMEKKQLLDAFRIWEPGEKYEKEYRDQYEFFKKNKDLMKEE